MLRLLISFFPIPLLALPARILSTIATSAVILTGTSYGEKNVLANKHLVLIGDISYALYLIHWPIVVWIKFSYPEELKCAPFFGILASIFLAYLVYMMYESWYLKLEKLQIAILIAILYGLVLALAVNSEHLESLLEQTQNHTIIDHDSVNISREEAIKLNRYWAKSEYNMLIIPNCYPNKTEHGFCSFPYNEKGKYRIMVLGNSYGANMGELFYETFGRYAKNMSKFTHSYCEVLVVDKKNKACLKVWDTYLEQAANFKPDFLFIVARSFVMNEPIEDPIKILDDQILKEAVQRLKKYEELAKYHVFIVGTIPTPIDYFLTKYTDKIDKKQNVTSSEFIKDKSYLNGIKRNLELGKLCPKCTILPFGNPFFAIKPYENPQFFDPKTLLGYFFDGTHLTPAGQQLLKPVLEKQLRDFEKDYL
ncbi:hypothetical protein WR25_23215 isoform A [Diploscapter pachys]|uniref:SGNH domain-containing protein n=2 Tax=Diploscapter pachys TaxID=2018661 RepID=A0A2A2JK10_9BILA|nr:hypothetical protein WR25_23215 isoform A [Diploscapter pachys]